MEYKGIEGEPIRKRKEYWPVPITPWEWRSAEDKDSLIKDMKAAKKQGRNIWLHYDINKCWYCGEKPDTPGPLMRIIRNYPKFWIRADVCGYKCQPKVKQFLDEHLGPVKVV